MAEKAEAKVAKSAAQKEAAKVAAEKKAEEKLMQLNKGKQLLIAAVCRQCLKDRLYIIEYHWGQNFGRECWPLSSHTPPPTLTNTTTTNTTTTTNAAITTLPSARVCVHRSATMSPTR